MHTEGPKAEARKTREVSPATPRRTWLTKRTGEREASGRELHREGRKLRLRTSVRSASELSLQHRTREELAGWLAGWQLLHRPRKRDTARPRGSANTGERESATRQRETDFVPDREQEGGGELGKETSTPRGRRES